MLYGLRITFAQIADVGLAGGADSAGARGQGEIAVVVCFGTLAPRAALHSAVQLPESWMRAPTDLDTALLAMAMVAIRITVIRTAGVRPWLSPHGCLVF